jgi:hypothetical protein
MDSSRHYFLRFILRQIFFPPLLSPQYLRQIFFPPFANSSRLFRMLVLAGARTAEFHFTG